MSIYLQWHKVNLNSRYIVFEVCTLYEFLSHNFVIVGFSSSILKGNSPGITNHVDSNRRTFNTFGTWRVYQTTEQNIDSISNLRITSLTKMMKKSFKSKTNLTSLLIFWNVNQIARYLKWPLKYWVRPEVDRK